MGYSVFCVFLGGLVASLTILAALQVVSVLKLWQLRRTPLPTIERPPITVLKPLSGVDRELYGNLEAFARQDYPTFQIVFGVADASDPVLPLVRAFVREHPELDLAVCVGAPRTGANPKVSNLEAMMKHARYPHLLISDADVRPGADYLRTIASELASGDLVHSAPVGSGQRRLGAILESLHLNCFVAATLTGTELVGHHCVVGKSMLFRRDHLEQVGGFASVRDVLAEDYVLGQKFRHAGLRVRLSRYRLNVVQPRRSVGGFVERHLRWAQMRRWVSPGAFACEALGNPVGWLLLWLPSILASVAPGERQFWLLLALAVLGGKLAMDALVFRVTSGRRVRLRELLCLPLKDLLIACVWVAAVFDRRVNWRGNALTIGPGSVIVPCGDGGSGFYPLRGTNPDADVETALNLAASSRRASHSSLQDCAG